MDSDNNESDESSEQKVTSLNNVQSCTNCYTTCKIYLIFRFDLNKTRMKFKKMRTSVIINVC